MLALFRTDTRSGTAAAVRRRLADAASAAATWTASLDGRSRSRRERACAYRGRRVSRSCSHRDRRRHRDATRFAPDVLDSAPPESRSPPRAIARRRRRLVHPVGKPESGRRLALRAGRPEPDRADRSRGPASVRDQERVASRLRGRTRSSVDERPDAAGRHLRRRRVGSAERHGPGRGGVRAVERLRVRRERGPEAAAAGRELARLRVSDGRGAQGSPDVRRPELPHRTRGDVPVRLDGHGGRVGQCDGGRRRRPESARRSHRPSIRRGGGAVRASRRRPRNGVRVLERLDAPRHARPRRIRRVPGRRSGRRVRRGERDRQPAGRAARRSDRLRTRRSSSSSRSRSCMRPQRSRGSPAPSR